ncbi:MAG: TetR family transcriptional regulator [Streptosporangiales bacterium]|nr:TetR family transcriptional regulator [Streptosporangiales bacterium]
MAADGTASAEPVRRMRRVERREQILGAATRAFARTGFVHTSLDDVAAEAGITRVLLYRHFDSKADMYRAVLDRACRQLETAVDVDNLGDDSLPALVRAAAADPDGFRLLFHHAAREPEFRGYIDALTTASTEIAHRNLTGYLPAGPWLDWAARIVPRFAIEAVISWLDAGRPDPDHVAERIDHAIRGIMRAAGPNGG